MTPLEFRSALEKGLGRAILYLQKSDPAPFFDVILDASVRNTVYDKHYFGANKAEYLLEIFELTGRSDELIEAMLKAYDDFDLEERPDTKLIMEIAKRGNAKARRLVKQDFLIELDEKSKYAGGDLIKVGGASAFLYVAKRLGRLVKTDPAFQPVSYYLRDLRSLDLKENSEPKLPAILEKARLENSDVDTHLTYIEAQLVKPERKFVRYEQLSYPETKARIEDPQDTSSVGYSWWGEYASYQELRMAANDLLLETQPERIRLYLEVFRDRCFPLGYTKLMPFIDHEDPKVVRAAMQALGSIKHKTIRVEALRRLTSSEWAWEALWMLRRNYLPEDAKLFTEIIQESNDEEIELLGHQMHRVLEENCSPEALEPIQAIYESGSCVALRASVVELLQEHNLLPDWMLEECCWDSYQHFRKKARTWANYP